MKKKTTVLITNDDGIQADGIRHLWKSQKNHFDATIVAPAFEKSGTGLAISLVHPLQIRSFSWEEKIPAWSINGTPADCVKLALSVVLKEKPDIILSGINRGSNSGRNALYSGTIGGVIEGVLRGIPGIAFSCEDTLSPNFSFWEKYIPTIVNYFLIHPLPFGTFANITFPKNISNGVKGMKFTRQGKGYYIENPDKRIHPEGHNYYWLGSRWHTKDIEEEDTDTHLLQHGYITATPLHISELTDHAAIESHKEKFEQLFHHGIKD